MNLSQYARCLKNLWWIVVVTTLIGALAGALSALVVPKSYQSESQVFVNVANPRSVTDLQMGEQFAVARAGSYAKVATTSSVLQPVADRLDLAETPEQLAQSRVTATNEPNTAMITITATGTSAQQAADLAQSTAESLVRESQSLETIPQSVDGQQPARVKLNVVQRAAVPAGSAGPATSVNVALGALVGLILGLLLVLWRGSRAASRAVGHRRTENRHGGHRHTEHHEEGATREH